MGLVADFEIAIEEGATHIRIVKQSWVREVQIHKL